MFAVFYFFIIRPENKKKKKTEEMRSSLSPVSYTHLYLQQLLDEPVEEPGLGRIGGLIVDLLALPAADYQPGGAQLTQVVGDGRTAHIHHGGEIYDTFLTVAQQPEELYPAAVVQLAQQLGYQLKCRARGAAGRHLLGGMPVVVGQLVLFHCHPS